MKKIYTIIASLMLTVFVFGQEGNKDVTIISSGSGLTLEEAKQSALRSATEQAFGAFISTKTEVFNDEVVADQMSSVSSGNIKSFEILTQDQFPDGRWSVTLKTLLSIDKLTSFVEAKGIEIEIKGGLFALNIKQQILNEQGESEAIYSLVGLLHETMQTCFNYTIKSSDPKSLDADNKNWEIPLQVIATCNSNMDFCAQYFTNALKALSLSYEEIATYKSLNKKVFQVSVLYKGKTEVFSLRKQTSIQAINSLLSNWEFYTRLFVLDSGIDQTFGDRIGNFQNLNVMNTSISFQTAGNAAAIFKWSDKRSLAQIEQMTSYSVKPRGVVSNFSHGGYVVNEIDGHGLVVSLFDIGKFEWNPAKVACEDFVINGYDDWMLPSKHELQAIYTNLFEFKLGGFMSTYYWSRTCRDGQYTGILPYNFLFEIGKYGKYSCSLPESEDCWVRPIRTF